MTTPHFRSTCASARAALSGCAASLLLSGCFAAFAQNPSATPPPPAPAANSATDKAVQELKDQLQKLQDQLNQQQELTKQAQDAADKTAADAKAAKEAAVKTGADVSKANDAVNNSTAAASDAQKASKDAGDHKDTAAKNAATTAALTKKARESAAQADASAGIALNGSADVQDNVEVQAVLLPHKPAMRIFGKEIADNYAIVQVTISNQSLTSALVVQSISLDYSNWLMSGLSSSDEDCPRVKKKLEKSFQRTCPTRVASVEARVIRGELQDASVWTARNGIVRGLILVGSVATGFSFLGPKGFTQAVTGWNGSLVPGVQSFWPDQTLPQINRVSDFGFQTNKVIGKENADIVYAFFPIDRFLTPGLRKIFLASPALFFAPFEIFADPYIGTKGGRYSGRHTNGVSQKMIDDFQKELLGIVGIPAGEDPKTRNNRLVPMNILLSHCLEDEEGNNCKDVAKDVNGDDLEPSDFKKYLNQARMLEQLISGISLNRINLLVGGIMTVDVTTVPASLKHVTFAKSDQEVFGKTCSPATGTIEGQFLTGGVPTLPSIILPSNLPKDSPYIDKKAEDFVDFITAVSEQSNDLSIAFELQLKNPIPPGSTVKFSLAKFNKGDDKKANPIQSADFDYVVKDYTPKPNYGNFNTDACKPQATQTRKPDVNNVTFDDKDPAPWAKTGTFQGTIHGSGLKDGIPKISAMKKADKSDLVVNSFLPDGSIKPASAGSTDDTLNFSITPTAVIPPGTTLLFTVTTKDNEGKDQTTDPQLGKYTTPAAKLSPAPKPSQTSKTPQEPKTPQAPNTLESPKTPQTPKPQSGPKPATGTHPHPG